MKLPKVLNMRGERRNTVVLEDVEMEIPTCTFDEDADPSIERCWATDEESDFMGTKNITAGGFPGMTLLEQRTGITPLSAAAGISLVMAVFALLYREMKVRKKEGSNDGQFKQSDVSSTPEPSSPSEMKKTLKVLSHVGLQPAGESHSNNASRLKEVRTRLEKETKEKQGLSEQNNFLKSALEERKSTVQMFTSELQSRDEQLAIFEQEQVKVKEELYNEIEALKTELQGQEKLQQENLSNMDSQCADLAGKVEGLMKELESREEQWQNFEKEAKAREQDSAVQIEAIKKEFAAKERAQMENLDVKSKECSELSSKIEVLTTDMKESEEQFTSFQKQRQKWSEATVEMKRTLQGKKDEIVGLRTRMELFISELGSREERVTSLEQKLEAKKELTAELVESLTTDLQEQKAEQEEWNTKTTKISHLLEEREAETKELIAKLENLTNELKSTLEKVSALEASVADKEHAANSKAEHFQTSLDESQQTRSKYNESILEIKKKSNERQEECASLVARLEMLTVELQTRETIVTSLEAKIKDREEVVTSQIEVFEKQLKANEDHRHSWSKSTEEIRRLLEEKKGQCVGLQTRVDLFKIELQKRDDLVVSLENVLKEKEDHASAKLEPYRAQLQSHQKDLEKWNNSTEEISRLLKDRQEQCVGLKTRLSLFTKQMQQHQEQVETLTGRIENKEADIGESIVSLKEQLRNQLEDRDSWDEKTIEIGRLFKDRQEQCIGLSTRLGLFQQQTQYHKEQVALLESSIAHLEEKSAYQVDPLRDELKVKREGLDSWRDSTLNVERLLKEAQEECVELTAELKNHVLNLQNDQQGVAILELKVADKEDLAASRREAYLVEHKQQEEERQKWTTTTQDLEKLLKDKEGQILGLTTRLSLFESERSKRENIVASLELNLKERGHKFESEIRALQNELAFQKEQRDHVLESTLHMNKSMKEVKEPCIGLTTRITLFRKELDAREERVRVLEAQVEEKQESVNSELEPLRVQYRKAIDDRDKWNDATLEIFWMLKDRQDQTTGLSTRLELFMDELHKKEEAVENLEERLKQAERSLAQVKATRNQIIEQQEQLRKWKNTTDEVSKLLKEKEGQRAKSYEKESLDKECSSLSAKLDLYRGEVQRREEKIKDLTESVDLKEELAIGEREAAKKKMPALKEDRDSWMEKTLDINRRHKAVQAECTGLTTRWELFKIEQKNKKELVVALESKLHEKEQYFTSLLGPYKKELEVQTDLRNKWRETTQKMDRLLKRKESDCITFSTQLESSIDELSSRKQQVAKLESLLNDEMKFSSSEMQRLEKQLAEQKLESENWKQSTLDVERLLQDKKQECANLQVRLQVFRRQVENQSEQIARMESAYKAKQDEATAQMDELQAQLREQEKIRDKSVDGTLEINQQIKNKEMQCTSVSVRLDLFRAELKNRENHVAQLEGKLRDAEDLSASSLNPMREQLASQKEELSKWEKSTVDIEELLKKRDEERIGLSTRLKLFQLQLKTVGENVAKLEMKVKQREEAFAEEVAPFQNALEVQQAEQDRWTKATKEIQDLLEDRKSQITGLKTRLSLFRREVKHREDLVESIKEKLEKKETELDNEQLEPIRTELASQKEQRDQWAQTTAGVVSLLKDNEEHVAGLTTRLACFRVELSKREEACNEIKKKLYDHKELSESQIGILRRELAAQVEQRDQWHATTTDLQKQIDEKKKESVELLTRLELVQREIETCDKQIQFLAEKIRVNDAALAEVEKLKKELKIQQDHRDELNKNTVETDKLLKEKKDECAGLSTRLVVFRQELQKRTDRLTSMETEIEEKEELSNAQIESLMNEIQTQREQREKWSSTTEEMKNLLKEKESQCLMLSAELELLTKLQG